MKIAGTGPVQPTSLRGRRQSPQSKSVFESEISSENSVKGATPATEVASSSMLLSIQEIGDSLDGRRRAMKRGLDILDRLDELRHGLLIGAFSPVKLDNLLKLTRKQQSMVTDPKLREILLEIETRAAVELAKLGKL